MQLLEKERMLSTGELARLLGRPVRTVKRWMQEAWRDKSLEVTRTEGGHYRIPWRVAKEFIR
jgi:excisionase family DNA binding protein